MNNRGPKTDPHGTTRLIHLNSDAKGFTEPFANLLQTCWRSPEKTNTKVPLFLRP